MVTFTIDLILQGLHLFLEHNNVCLINCVWHNSWRIHSVNIFGRGLYDL